MIRHTPSDSPERDCSMRNPSRSPKRSPVAAGETKPRLLPRLTFVTRVLIQPSPSLSRLGTRAVLPPSSSPPSISMAVSLPALRVSSSFLFAVSKSMPTSATTVWSSIGYDDGVGACSTRGGRSNSTERPPIVWMPRAYVPSRMAPLMIFSR